MRVVRVVLAFLAATAPVAITGLFLADSESIKTSWGWVLVASCTAAGLALGLLAERPIARFLLMRTGLSFQIRDFLVRLFAVLISMALLSLGILLASWLA